MLRPFSPWFAAHPAGRAVRPPVTAPVVPHSQQATGLARAVTALEKSLRPPRLGQLTVGPGKSPAWQCPCSSPAEPRMQSAFLDSNPDAENPAFTVVRDTPTPRGARVGLRFLVKAPRTESTWVRRVSPGRAAGQKVPSQTQCWPSRDPRMLPLAAFPAPPITSRCPSSGTHHGHRLSPAPCANSGHSLRLLEGLGFRGQWNSCLSYLTATFPPPKVDLPLL